MSVASPSRPGASQAPRAALVVLCPNSWLPLEGDSEKVTEDYSVCLIRSSPENGSIACIASFPGGELTSFDRALAMVDGNYRSDHEDIGFALRVTAIRRTFESAGIMVAANPPPRFARQELQKILSREGPMAFHGFIIDWGIRLRPDDLAELASLWMPQACSQAEHVFLVQVPDAEEIAWVAAGGAEFGIVSWVTPSKVLRMYGQGEIQLTLVQWYVLHELVRSLPRLHGLPDLLAAAPSSGAPLWRPAALEFCMIEPALGSNDGNAICVLPGDEEHPSSPGLKGHRHRVLMERVGIELKACSLQRSTELLVDHTIARL